MIASLPLVPAWQPAPFEAQTAPHPSPPAQRAPARQRHTKRHDSALATLAHELRGPLHSLGASAAVLAEDLDELSTEQIRQMAHAIQRRALWLQGLTENLLAAASIERGGLSVQPRLEDLRETIDETALVVEPLLAQRNQRLTVEMPDVPATALFDSRRLSQALVNLILNASKYSDPGTMVYVTLAPAAQAGGWRISVADEGVGLPAVGVAALFEPYVRGDQTTDGLGLGLAVVKSIAAAHNGRVGAAPRAAGGAEFWIEL